MIWIWTNSRNYWTLAS